MFLSSNGRRVQKANPHHDPKTGRFTHAPAGSSLASKKPKKEPLGSAEGYVLVSREQNNPLDPKDGSLEIWRSNASHGSRIYFHDNGSDALTDAQKAKVMESVNECQSIATVGGAEIVVSEAPFTYLGLGGSGGFVIGAPSRESKDIQDVIHIHPNAIKDPSLVQSAVDSGWSIPEAGGNNTQYIVAHEYGHLVHNVRHRGMYDREFVYATDGKDDLGAFTDSETWSGDLTPRREYRAMEQALGATSTYGRTEPSELYAETFARFVFQTKTGSAYSEDVRVFMGGDLDVFGDWKVGMNVGDVPRAAGSISVDAALDPAFGPLIYLGSAYQ